MRNGNFEYSIGNKKIGKDTIIFNMGSATECASKQAGLCEINCYAMKSERLYPQTLPFRQRQEKYWLETDAFEIAERINEIATKRNSNTRVKSKIKYVRINEAGDLHSTECLTKLIKVAKMLPDLVLYTYTHRKDLIKSNTWKRLPNNLVINTSNFKRKNLNEFYCDTEVKLPRLKGENNYLLVRSELKKKHGHACLGDCSKCNLCKSNHGKRIAVPLH